MASKSKKSSARTPAKRAAKKASKSATSRGKAKKELSANEATLLAWKSTYANRHKRLD
jgi:hypothetical protein